MAALEELASNKLQQQIANQRKAAQVAKYAWPSIQSLNGLTEIEKLLLKHRLRMTMGNDPLKNTTNFLFGPKDIREHAAYENKIQKAMSEQTMADAVKADVFQFQCDKAIIELLSTYGKHIDTSRPYLFYLLETLLHDVNATVLYGKIDPSESKNSFQEVNLETMNHKDYVLVSLNMDTIMYIPNLIKIVLNQSRHSYIRTNEDFLNDPYAIEPYATISYGNGYENHYHVNGPIVLIQVVDKPTIGERVTQVCRQIGHRFGFHTPEQSQPSSTPRYMTPNGTFDKPIVKPPQNNPNMNPAKRQKRGGKQTKKQKSKKTQMKKRIKKQKQKKSTRKRK